MGEFREAYRFAKIAKALSVKFGSNNEAAPMVCMLTTQILAYVEPVQSVVGFHEEGGSAAIASGYTNIGIYNLYLGAGLSLQTGRKLKSVINNYEKCGRLAKQHQHFHVLVCMMPPYRAALALVGAEADKSFGSAANPMSVPIDVQQGKKSIFYKIAHFYKIYTAFMLRKFEACKALVEESSDFTVGVRTILATGSKRVFFGGLVSFWIAREKNDKAWKAKAQESMIVFKNLVETASVWNFQNKLHLLQAEEQFCERDFDLAESYYEAAISSAKEHRFLNDEALSLELAGVFYLETGRKKRSIPYLSQAVEKYREWGAHYKASSLEKYLEQV